MLDFSSWHGLIVSILTLIILFFGAPIIQLIKNSWTKLFGTVIEDKVAIIFVGILSCLLAVAEMALTGTLTMPTLQTFLAWAGGIMSVATIYYEFFAKTSGTLGQGLLLKSVEPPKK